MTELALIGKKIGMSREFYKAGQSVPVTVLKLDKARVIQVLEQEKRGYKAIQIGFGNVKTSKLSKAMKGYFAKKNTEPKKRLKEFRVANTEIYKEGNEFGLEINSLNSCTSGPHIHFAIGIPNPFLVRFTISLGKYFNPIFFKRYLEVLPLYLRFAGTLPINSTTLWSK